MEFSVQLLANDKAKLSAEELEWLRRAARGIDQCVACPHYKTGGERPGDLDQCAACADLDEQVRFAGDEDMECLCMEDAPGCPGDVWFHSGYAHNFEAVVNLVGRFISKWRPNMVWGAEFASTCSRPRLDSFGGGAVVVTRDGEEWLNTGLWVSDKCKAEVNRLRPSTPGSTWFRVVEDDGTNCQCTPERYDSLPEARVAAKAHTPPAGKQVKIGRYVVCDNGHEEQWQADYPAEEPKSE